MDRKLKLAVAALGGLGLAGCVVAVTAAATGIYRGSPTSQPASQPATAVSPAPQGNAAPGQAANPQAKAARQAVLQAEAQVLGLQPRALTVDLKQGQTVHQLADQKGIGQADFEARFNADLKAILDQEVQKGALSSEQEQQVLKRTSSTVPNWDQPARKK